MIVKFNAKVVITYSIPFVSCMLPYVLVPCKNKNTFLALNYKGKSIITQARIREILQINIISHRGERDLNVKQATVSRFQEIMAQRNIRPNELANLSGVTPSTVYSMLDERRKELSFNTIKKLCDGLEITLGEFFSTEAFDNLEQEIK